MDDPDRELLIEVMPSLFGGVGMIVLNWSFVESSLDTWTAIAFERLNGASVEKEVPRNFDRKVKYLRKAFVRIPELAPFATEALAIVERAKVLSDIRHFVVHGTLSKFDPLDEESFTFEKWDVSEDKSRHVTERMRIPGQRLINASNELLAMATASQKLSVRIVDAVIG